MTGTRDTGCVPRLRGGREEQECRCSGGHRSAPVSELSCSCQTASHCITTALLQRAPFHDVAGFHVPVEDRHRAATIALARCTHQALGVYAWRVYMDRSAMSDARDMDCPTPRRVQLLSREHAPMRAPSGKKTQPQRIQRAGDAVQLGGRHPRARRHRERHVGCDGFSLAATKYGVRTRGELIVRNVRPPWP